MFVSKSQQGDCGSDCEKDRSYEFVQATLDFELVEENEWWFRVWRLNIMVIYEVERHNRNIMTMALETTIGWSPVPFRGPVLIFGVKKKKEKLEFEAENEGVKMREKRRKTLQKSLTSRIESKSSRGP